MSGIHAKWETTDISELEWCLGIKVERDWDRGTISLNQALYIQDTVSRFQHLKLDARTRAQTPCGENIKELTKGAPDSEETTEVIDEYRSLVGALLWVANVTRPDISYAVSTLARFTACPERVHMKAATRVD